MVNNVVVYSIDLGRLRHGGSFYKRAQEPFASDNSYDLLQCSINLLVISSKTTDLDWYYSRHNQKLKFLIDRLSIHALCVKHQS